jgi:hypothetical protein
MATVRKRRSNQSPTAEAAGRPKSSSSRQQTKPGQRTQTGSPEIDGASAEGAPEKSKKRS